MRKVKLKKNYLNPLPPKNTKTERVMNYCNICEIRACGQKMQVKNYAYCPEYSCEKLKNVFETAPHAKNALEEIRKNL